ncbi:MAG TPA: glycosyltransferase [Gemmatimonadales bacterium]|nr:glycosyltransferase [Gemmatimonadales bacterium]
MPVVVSAIMPTYNSGEFIAAAVDSILAQTFRDWELIIVDDGSTDDTAAVLRRYQDPRITVHALPRNMGRAAARNAALALARGRYIALADSDDISLPDRFAVEVAYLDSHPEVDVVTCQMKYFWGDAPPRDGFLYPEEPEDIRRRFAGGRMAVSHGAALIRAECFRRHGGYAADCRRAEDLEFFLRIHQECVFRTLPDALYLYRHEPRAVPLRKWMDTAAYSRYASYRAGAVRAGTAPVSYAEFSRTPSHRLSLYTVELVKFFRYAALRYLQPKRRLR